MLPPIMARTCATIEAWRRDLFDASGISYAPIASEPDCRAVGRGYCGRARIAYALATADGRAGRGETLALDSHTAITIDALDDDNDRWPDGDVCAIYTYVWIALEMHRSP